MPTNDPRRFGEKEFALILRRAAELQERDAEQPLRAGLTVADIEAIAAEAGIDPKYIARAAASVVERGAAAWSDAVIPNGRVLAQTAVEGTLPPDALAAMIEVLQSETGRTGATRETMGGVEWTARDSFGPVHLVVRPTDGETRIQVATDRTQSGIVIGLLMPLAGFIAGSIAAPVLAVPAAAAVVVGAGAGVAGARLLWGRVVRKWRERVHRMVAGVTAVGSTPPSSRDD